MSMNVQVGGPDDGREKYSVGREVGRDNLLDLLDRHKQSKQELFGLLQYVVNNPHEVGGAANAINVKATVVYGSWTDVVSNIDKDCGKDEDRFFRSVSVLLAEDEKERADTLNTMISKTGVFKPAAGGDPEHLRIELLEAYEGLEEDSDISDIDAENYVGTAYGGMMAEDLKQLVQYLSHLDYMNRINQESETAESGAQSLKGSFRNIGRYVLDVAKIASGVSAGIVLAAMMKKRF